MPEPSAVNTPALLAPSPSPHQGALSCCGQQLGEFNQTAAAAVDTSGEKPADFHHWHEN